MPLETWWGETPLQTGDRRLWHIGSLRLAVRRFSGEVVVVWHDTLDALDPALVVNMPEEERLEGDKERLVVNAESITLSARLSDRAVVARPEEALTLPQGAEVTAYISAPVNVVMTCGSAVWEAASHRLSDTWFGPNTREGELAYASRTLLKLDASEVLRRPHRAVTPIVLSNLGDGPMTVDRIRVPLPRLSLYEGADCLWTSAVRLERGRGDEATMRVSPGPPPEADGGRLLAPPRVADDSNAVLRVFSLLEKMK